MNLYFLGRIEQALLQNCMEGISKGKREAYLDYVE